MAPRLGDRQGGERLQRVTNRDRLTAVPWPAVGTAGVVLLIIALISLSASTAVGRSPVPTAPSPYVASLRGPHLETAPDSPPATPVAVAPTAAPLDVRTPLPQPTPRSLPRATPPVVASGHSVTGVATWYCLPGVSPCMVAHPYPCLCAAAGPLLRAALGGSDHCRPGPGCWRDRVVTVWNGSAHVTVTLYDWCQCPGGHIIDLYGNAMAAIDPGFRANGGVHAARITW